MTLSIEKLKKQKKVKVLIIRLKPIGDTVLISPVFRNLKKLFPQASIDIIIYPFVVDAVKNNPYIDNVIILKRKNIPKINFYFKSLFKHYDIIIDYINNPTSVLIAQFTRAKIRIGNKTKRNFFYNYRIVSDKKEYSSIRCLRLLEPLGLQDTKDYMPEFYIDQKDKDTVERLYKTFNIKKPLITIFASAKYPTRQYSPENMANLGELIIKKTKNNLLFLFGKNDLQTFYIIHKQLKQYPQVHFFSPDITIGELSASIANSDILITNDTGPKHIATALKIPTLTIFSATDEEVWNPPDPKTAVTIRKKLDCAPCNKLICSKGSLECMKKLNPEEVFTAFQKMAK